MIQDALAMLASAQTLTSTADSSDFMDLGPMGNSLNSNTSRDIGNGENLFLALNVLTAFTASTAATMTPTIVCSPTSSFASTFTVLTGTALTSANLASTGLVAIYRLPPSDNWRRYVKGTWTVATGPFTAGVLQASIVKDINRWKALATGFHIS